MTTTRSRYQQTIVEIHAEIARLADRVEQGRCSQRLLDAYVAAARERTDWTERAPRLPYMYRSEQ